MLMKKLIVLSLLFCMIHIKAQKSETMTYVCPPCNGGCDEMTYKAEGKCTHCGMQLIKKTKAMMSDKKMTICFYLQDGVEVLDFAGPMEVFAYAGFEIFTVSKTKAPITSQGILKILPDYSLQDAPAFDVLATFGGNAGNASNDPEVIQWIQSKANSTQNYFSVCTGAFIFSKAGLLDNQTVTTFHLSIADLQKATPKAKVLSDKRFVDNGKVITTAGISAGIDGALHFVAKIKGKDVAKSVAEYMEYDKWVPEQGLVVEQKD
jgi:transcriptional regulator GlxA family with amidase domain